MSERSPRLRALRPRPQQQHQQAKSETSPRRIEVKRKDVKDEEESNDETTNRRYNKERNVEITSDNDQHPGESPRKTNKKDIKDIVEGDSSGDDKQYECKICTPPKKYTTLKLYMQHFKTEHDSDKKSKEEGKEVQIKSHLRGKFFRCVKCNYITNVRARFTKHVKYHSMPMIKCDTCDFRTPYKWNLDRHTRNHGGGGAFQCQVCNFTADIRQSLTVHETNHHEPPVGTANRKPNPFDRKPRNGSKRYNQVGASDFREPTLRSNENTSQPKTILSPPSNSMESVPGNEEVNDTLGAECISLKCDEKGCQFITAWDSEMQRHLSECHGSGVSTNKQKKPLPMLIPLSPANVTKPNNLSSNDSSATLLKVPRVRVRPELAQIARDNELAKLQANKIAEVKRDLGNNSSLSFRPIDSFERKNASFFDKLKERLSSTTVSNVIPEIAVTTINDLKCWCTFEASNLEELNQHKTTHHTALSVSLGISRCPKCRRRCKSSSDLEIHMRQCRSSENNQNQNSTENLENDETNSEQRSSSFRGEYSFPSQMDWDSSYGETSSYGNSVGGNNLGDQGIEELNVEEEADRLANLITNSNKNYLQPPELTPAPVAVLNTDANTEGTSNVPLRPPPPLKAANRNQGFSLLRKNSTSPTNLSRSITPVSLSSGMDEPRKSAWKCKRCNFKDSDRSVVLQHVKMQHSHSSDSSNNDKNPFGCGDCPFSAPDSATLAVHRMHHRPNLDAIFKCYFCPYYVTTKAELLEHSRLHGEDLANVHQNNMESESYSVNAKKQLQQNLDNASRSSKDDSFQERSLLSPTTSTASGASLYKNPEVPSLLLDTRELPDAPLVWVSRPDGVIAKMLKCRHCPYVSQRRAEVLDHETMHANSALPGPFIECPQCSFSCSRTDIMESHSDMHKGSLGTVHCLVDDSRPDSQQLNDLATLLGLSKPPDMGAEPDLDDSRLVHCCSKCPARFLCEKELRIHFRYHSTELAYNCQWCSYAARQPAHLLSHQKAHAPEYQERTRYLLSIYGHSQRHPPPTTACIEAGGQESADGNSPRVAWIVVEVPATSEQNFGNNVINNGPRPANQVYTCAKCPARYFKLDALEYHMTLHGSNNRFKCSECDYSSKTAQNLVKHQVVHRRHTEATNANATVRIPPPDPQFGTFMRGNPNFVYPGYLRNGRLKEKRYKCHKCPSAFEKRDQYRVHLGLHGAKQRYCCGSCDYSVKYYANYVQHLKKHEANALAQAERRQGDVETIPIENEIDEGIFSGRCGKSLKKTSLVQSQINPLQTSNQDKQSVMLMQRREMQALIESEPKFRCQSCPFFSNDKDIMDAHKRRHGIDRMTPSCPYCDYVPKKEENIAEHNKLHFTRMFKPESYLVVELVSLSMEKINESNKKSNVEKEMIFQECADGKYLPSLESSACLNSPNPTGTQEKMIIDPQTGEVKPQRNV
ncbi:zinc finger protein Xfin-like isoform X2 [Leptopilina boulardi]|uniref:zinc finger protein Xfin-like isoform X2 n=1 Tax=Leptopilina boulardi TaxID=63433 RepID=UPI0021F64700|nr:zinc finger protein Xfin-like isoform X2 [Leptopilina boulardi]